MTYRQHIRLAGLANIVGGIAIAIFVIEHPWGRFFGAEVGRTWAWQVAHTFHLIGATFALLGLLGLYARQTARFGRFGFVAFVLAFLGTAWFVGTGMITAFIWPMLAAVAPDAVAATGAIVRPPAIVALAMTATTLTVGYFLFVIASWRTGIFPRWALVMWAAGASLGMVPPTPVGPLPWASLVAGGVIYAIGASWLGWTLWVNPVDAG